MRALVAKVPANKILLNDIRLVYFRRGFHRDCLYCGGNGIELWGRCVVSTDVIQGYLGMFMTDFDSSWWYFRVVKLTGYPRTTPSINYAFLYPSPLDCTRCPRRRDHIKHLHSGVIWSKVLLIIMKPANSRPPLSTANALTTLYHEGIRLARLCPQYISLELHMTDRSLVKE